MVPAIGSANGHFVTAAHVNESW